MNPLLDGCGAKLGRGEQHLNALKFCLDLDKACDPQFHPVTIDVEMNQHTGRFKVPISGLPVIGDDCGILIGDCLQNFRASLDQLASLLVRRRGRKGLSPSQKRAIQWPMANSACRFGTGYNSRLPGVPVDPYGARVKRYQPYRRGSAGKAIRWLRRLSDMDKHRIILPALMGPGH